MGTGPADFETATVDGTLVVRVHRADLRSREAQDLVRLVLESTASASGAVVINLQAVRVLNSVAIGALARIADARRCVLVGVEPLLAGALRLMAVVPPAALVADEASALRALAPGAASRGGASPR